MRLHRNVSGSAAQGLRPYTEMNKTGVEWLGEVPAHWAVTRAKSLLSRNESGVWGRDPTDDGVVVLRSTEQTIGGEWNIRAPAVRRLTVSEYVACRLKEGDLVVTKSSGSALHIGKTSIVTKEIAALDCCFSHFMQRLRVKQNTLPRYVWYALNAELGREQLSFLSNTTTGLANLNGDIIGGVVLPAPPPAEQGAIVRFLDPADRRIRRYIRAKQKLITLLEEQKQAIIHEAVTGQIDVRTGRPYPDYKDSGVEWLGAVPAHWDVWRSKRVFRPRTELARPGDTQLSATQAYGVIAQAAYEEKIGRKVTKILRHLDQRRHVEVDDFVLSMRSFQGGLERAWESGCIRSSYIVLQAATVRLIVGYFGHLFKSAGYIGALQSTANFIRDGQDLNFDNFCQVDVPVPPSSEQQEIAQALDTEKGHVGSRIERSRQQIDLLREYRTRLIADVVTGKLDVRETAAACPEIAPMGEDDVSAPVLALEAVKSDETDVGNTVRV